MATHIHLAPILVLSQIFPHCSASPDLAVCAPQSKSCRSRTLAYNTWKRNESNDRTLLNLIVQYLSSGNRKTISKVCS